MILRVVNVSIGIIIRKKRVKNVKGAAGCKPGLSSRESRCELHSDDTGLSMAVSLSVEKKKKFENLPKGHKKKKISMLRLYGRSCKGCLTCYDKTMVWCCTHVEDLRGRRRRAD